MTTPNPNEIIEACARIVEDYSRGAFTGWTGKTGDSKITLDEAEDHFSICVQELAAAIRAQLTSMEGK